VITGSSLPTPLQEALTDLKLPVAKPKGRPRNFNKTSQVKFSSQNNPGALEFYHFSNYTFGLPVKPLPYIIL